MDVQEGPRKDRSQVMTDHLVKLPVRVVKYLTVSAVSTLGEEGTTVEYVAHVADAAGVLLQGCLGGMLSNKTSGRQEAVRSSWTCFS